MALLCLGADQGEWLILCPACFTMNEETLVLSALETECNPQPIWSWLQGEKTPYSCSVSSQPNGQQPVITLSYTKLMLWEVPHTHFVTSPGDGSTS